MDVDAEKTGLFTAVMEVEDAVAVVIANHGDQLTLHLRFIGAAMFSEAPTLAVLAGLQNSRAGWIYGSDEVR